LKETRETTATGNQRPSLFWRKKRYSAQEKDSKPKCETLQRAPIRVLQATLDVRGQMTAL
jgi:hypothetical protein